MQLRYRTACITAVCTAALLTVLRLLGGGSYTAALFVAVIAVAALFVLCGNKPREQFSVSGTPAKVTAAIAALAGVALLICTFREGLQLAAGAYPYPAPVDTGFMHPVFLAVRLVGGVVGGVFLILIAVRWFTGGCTDRGRFGVLALFPVVWLWGRLFWYLFSFASAVNRFRSLVEVGLLLFEMLFLLAFARYTSGIEEEKPRTVIPVALCTVMLGLAACVTRAIALVTQNASLFSATELILAPDFAFVLLAAAWAYGQLFCEGTVAPPLPDEPPEEPVAEEAEEEPYLLDEDALRVADEEAEEEPASTEERRPLELEDIINEIINRNS